MKKINILFRSFRTKLALVLIFSMLFAGCLSNFLIYKFALESQFNQLRSRLKVIAQTSALLIDADQILQVPLNKEGVNTPQYKEIAATLEKIKKVNPTITYVYTMKKTETPGIYEFIVDPEPEADEEGGASAYPGDDYDATAFPEMLKAFDGPAADKELGADVWGIWLSGYAPIRNEEDEAVAILGVDVAADDIYMSQRKIRNRAVFVFAVGIIFSLFLGMLIAARVAVPLKKLAEVTRHIAKGNFQHEIKLKGDYEITELASSFNKMSSDLNKYTDELRRTTAEKERLHKELEIARGIQQSFLPSAAPLIKGFEIAATSLPAKEVGGDFYDFIPIEKDKWGVAVADVSGKGIPAALFMALSRTLIRASTKGNDSVGDAIKQANRLIFEDSRTNMFVTLFYAILDAEKMRLRYVNAGHNPPLLLREAPSDVVLLKAKGIPLGLFSDIEMPVEEIGLKKGDLVALYTDGITEAINAQREQFGIERLGSIIRDNYRSSAAEIMKKTQKEVERFTEGQPQFDDITLMILKAD
jgi:serine phosphatase RsbU (regulator of sigma subunit)